MDSNVGDSIRELHVALHGCVNRFALRRPVLMTWVWAYLTYQRSVRILTPERLSLQDVASLSDAAQPGPSRDPNSPLEPDTQQKSEAWGAQKDEPGFLRTTSCSAWRFR
jgi:hypothetical protein